MNPAPPPVKTLCIDGTDVSANADQTILDAAPPPPPGTDTAQLFGNPPDKPDRNKEAGLSALPADVREAIVEIQQPKPLPPVPLPPVPLPSP